ETEEITDTEENQGAPLAQEQMVDEHLVDAGASSAHFTQKAAASMEAIVTRFYDLVVQILYQIVHLFFKSIYLIFKDVGYDVLFFFTIFYLVSSMFNCYNLCELSLYIRCKSFVIVS